MGTEHKPGLLFHKKVNQGAGIESIKSQSSFLKMPRSIKRLVDETEQIRLPAHQIDIEVGVNPFEDRIRVAEHLHMSRSHSLRLK